MTDNDFVIRVGSEEKRRKQSCQKVHREIRDKKKDKNMRGSHTQTIKDRREIFGKHACFETESRYQGAKRGAG